MQPFDLVRVRTHRRIVRGRPIKVREYVRPPPKPHPRR